MNHKKSTLFIIIALATINFFAHGAKEKEVQEEPPLKPKTGSPEFNDFIRLVTPRLLETLESPNRDFMVLPRNNPNIITILGYKGEVCRAEFCAPKIFYFSCDILQKDILSTIPKTQTTMEKNLNINVENISFSWTPVWRNKYKTGNTDWGFEGKAKITIKNIPLDRSLYTQDEANTVYTEFRNESGVIPRAKADELTKDLKAKITEMLRLFVEQAQAALEAKKIMEVLPEVPEISSDTARIIHQYIAEPTEAEKKQDEAWEKERQAMNAESEKRFAKKNAPKKPATGGLDK